ncbi:hypothetical protein H0H92_010741 [Tricholoma furcatifolium]|nr:hypothetical protein H0H92_010741 [Tricholoma furcatifolium]
MAPTSLHFLLYLLTFSLLYSVEAEPLHLTLSRRAGYTVHDTTYWAKTADHVRAKYGYTKNPAKRRRSTAGFSLVDEGFDSTYYSTASIGTPAQNFNFILDTGSSDLWVVDSQCTSCGTISAPTYVASASSSLILSNSDIQIQYGSGSVGGQIGQDTVSMVAANQMTSNLLESGISGIMGLAFPTIAETQATPFWDALTISGKLDNPEMSFWLARDRDDPNASNNAPGGIFTLGGTNSSLYTGNIEFLDLAVTTPTYWLLSMSAITVQGKEVATSTGSAALSAIDTGTTLIGGPTADVEAIWAAVPGSQTIPSILQHERLYQPVLRGKIMAD